MLRSRGIAAFLLGFLLCPSLFAHPASRPASGRSAGAQQPPKAAAATAVAASRELLAAGRLEEALERVNAVLQQDPANREAVLVKLTALLGSQRFDEALACYDGYTSATSRPDPALLAFMGRADLRRLLQQRPRDMVAVAGALERLARDGDVEARETLRQEAASSTPQEALALNVSLARLGDQQATRRLGERLNAASTAAAKTEVIRGLQDAGARSQGSKVAALLRDPEPQVRSAAALATGALQFADAVPLLESIFKEDAHVVRMSAAVALKQLGRSTADLYLAQLLKNDMPEVRLVAAEAYQRSKTTQWVPSIRALLTDRNDLNRLRAAELLACCDPTAARLGLLPALNSPNPFLRAEAARILEAKGLVDAPMARLLLGDPVGSVRLHGAGAALLLAAPRSR